MQKLPSMTQKNMPEQENEVPGMKVPENLQAMERHEDYYENTVIRSF